MENEVSALQEILQSVVNDLERTTAEVTVLLSRVHGLNPYTPQAQQAALRAAAKKNAEFYAGLKSRIGQLSDKRNAPDGPR